MLSVLAAACDTEQILSPHGRTTHRWLASVWISCVQRNSSNRLLSAFTDKSSQVESLMCLYIIVSAQDNEQKSMFLQLLGNRKKKKSLLWFLFVRSQAVEQLNIKTKTFKDLLTDEPFTRKDLITLQVGCCWSLKCIIYGENDNASIFFWCNLLCFVFVGPHQPG